MIPTVCFVEFMLGDLIFKLVGMQLTFEQQLSCNTHSRLLSFPRHIKHAQPRPTRTKGPKNESVSRPAHLLVPNQPTSAPTIFPFPQELVSEQEEYDENRELSHYRSDNSKLNNKLGLPSNKAYAYVSSLLWRGVQLQLLSLSKPIDGIELVGADIAYRAQITRSKFSTLTKHCMVKDIPSPSASRKKVSTTIMKSCHIPLLA
jgi:hypothetical protein